MEKYHPSLLRSDLPWGGSLLSGMNSLSYKSFIFRKLNSSFYWGFTQVTYLTQAGCLLFLESEIHHSTGISLRWDIALIWHTECLASHKQPLKLCKKQLWEDFNKKVCWNIQSVNRLKASKKTGKNFQAVLYKKDGTFFQ